MRDTLGSVPSPLTATPTRLQNHGIDAVPVLHVQLRGREEWEAAGENSGAVLCPASAALATHVLRRLVAVDPLAVWRQEAHLVLGDALLVAVGIEDLAQRGRGGGKATGLSVPAAQGALVLTR